LTSRFQFLGALAKLRKAPVSFIVSFYLSIRMKLLGFLLLLFFSIGPTARCGLWPVEQYPSIFSYLSPTILGFHWSDFHKI
jgi:hypothetical protein